MNCTVTAIAEMKTKTEKTEKTENWDIVLRKPWQAVDIEVTS